MRGKRAKQYRKLMHAYQLSFSFHEPYQVLLDAALIRIAQQSKMALGSLLGHTLHGTIKPMITQCCIRHLYALPASAEKDAAIAVAKQAERRRCGHHELEEPLSTRECLESVVDPKGSGTNRHRYVVASQDPEVRDVMRRKIGVPIVYVNRSVMILEPMGRATEGVREKEERGKIRAGLKRGRGADVGEKRTRDEDGPDTALEEPRKKKVKGVKGPNPLSVKKSKKSKVVGAERENEDVTTQKVERRRSVDYSTIIASKPDELGDDLVDGPRKRKRKRKPKESEEVLDATEAVAASE